MSTPSTRKSLLIGLLTSKNETPWDLRSSVLVRVLDLESGATVFSTSFRDRRPLDDMVETVSRDLTTLTVSEFRREYGIEVLDDAISHGSESSTSPGLLDLLRAWAKSARSR